MIKNTFLINIPNLRAIFKLITTTEGTARPRAQGQDATNIDIDLSNGKHHTQY